MHDYDSSATTENVKTNGTTRPARPKRTIVVADNIPETLKKLPQWCVWRYRWKDGRWTKIPYQTNNVPAESDNPTTWTTYEDALQHYRERPGVDGIGFFLGDSGIVAGDVDNKDGDGLPPVADEWIETIQSYCELSPSEKGLRFFAFGSLPCENGHKPRYKREPFELYDKTTNRFMTVTGWQIGPVKDLCERTNEIAEIHRRWILPEPPKPDNGHVQERASVESKPLPDGITVEDVVAVASTAKNGEKFKKLWAGKWEPDYPSQNEADLALCSILAFYIPKPETIDAVFRHSGLMREKWERREKYRAETIGKAVEICSAHFSDWTEYLRRKRTQEAVEAIPPMETVQEPPQVSPEYSFDALDYDDLATAENQGPAPQPQVSTKYSFEPLDSATFAGTDYKNEWLVKGVLVKDQPVVIGGPQKSLKTTISEDLVISLGSGTPFLGAYPTVKTRTAFISLESGHAVIKETALRICRARGVALSSLDVFWDFRRPRLSIPEELEILAQGLEKRAIKLCVVDPAYLCLLAGVGGDKARNVYDMGDVLGSVAQTLGAVGCQTVLNHHTKKTLSNPYVALELTDLAFSGLAEYARQWILISRREQYRGDGIHRLHFVYGGSAGQGGFRGLDIDEGTLGDDFTGRKWQVQVVPYEEIKDRKTQEREAKLSIDENRLLALIDLEPYPTKSKLRERSGWNGAKLGNLLFRLCDRGQIQPVEELVPSGKGAKQRSEVYRRKDQSDQSDDQSDNPSD